MARINFMELAKEKNPYYEVSELDFEYDITKELFMSVLNKGCITIKINSEFPIVFTAIVSYYEENEAENIIFTSNVNVGGIVKLRYNKEQNLYYLIVLDNF